MNIRALEILQELRGGYADSRLSVFDVAVETGADGELVFTGRVLDQSVLDRLHRRFEADLPGLARDDRAVQVLRRACPDLLAVSTNLTGLHAGPAFQSELISQMVYGTVVEVLEERESWALIRQDDGYLGWTYRPYLEKMDPPESTHLVTAAASVLRCAPDPHSEVISRVFGGTFVCLADRRGDWAEVVAHERGWLRMVDLRALSELPRGAAERRRCMAVDGQRLMGVPYLWGGCSANGIDGSALARLLHRWVGIAIPRDADMQVQAGRAVEPPFLAGTLIFFGEKSGQRRITHVAVSLGGWVVLHSSRARNGVYVDDVQAIKHLRESFFAACTYLD